MFKVHSMVRMAVAGALLLLVGAGIFWFSISGLASSAASVSVGDEPLSPDATNAKVVYQKGPNATSDIYTTTPGSGVLLGLRRGFHPAYSPDGTKIAFADNTAGAAQSTIMIMNADGTNVRSLVPAQQGFNPTWSSDGSRLAFVRGNFFSTGDTGSGQIYVVDVAGGAEVALAGMNNASKPTWGANNRIAYQCRASNGIPLGICVSSTIQPTPLIGANPPTITNLPSSADGNDRDAAWSYDGTMLAFLSTRDYPMATASEIYVMDASGGNVRRVTTSNDFKTGPAWAPDGTRIVFSRNGAQGSSSANLRIVNADGSNGSSTTPLTVFNSGDHFPNWGAAVVVAAPQSVVLTGAGSNPNVKVFGGASGAESQSFMAFPGSDTSGVRVASGDIDGDGKADTIAANGPGSSGSVKVFSGEDNSEIRNILPYDAGFTGGVFVASADINGDGRDDIITGAGSGGLSHVKVFNGLNNGEIFSFVAFDVAFQGGVQVGAGDINGDGRKDIIAGAGLGQGLVKVFSGTNGAEFRNFFPFGAGMTGGVFVAGGDVNGDGRDDIVTGAGPGFSPNVKAFSGTDNVMFRDFYPYDLAFRGGARVAAGDIDRDGRVDIITGPGAGMAPNVKVYSGTNESVLRNFLAYGDSMTAGVFVGAARPSSTPPAAQVDLWMQSMDSPLVVAQGSNFTFDFVIKNLSTTGATGVKIVFDPIPPSIRHHPIQSNCSMVATTRVVTCTYANIAAGATVNLSTIFIAEVPGTVEARAKVSSNEADPDESNNFKTALTLIEVPADVAILDPVAPAAVPVNSTVTYRFRVANYGPGAAAGGVLQANFSSHFQPLTSNYFCAMNGNGMICNLGSIAAACPNPATGCPANSFRDVILVARAISSGTGTSAGSAELSVTTDSVDNMMFNNNRTVRTDILPTPAAEVVGIEVTQAVQNFKNDTPLVAGRQTFVRAHLKKLSPGTIALGATLTVRNPDTGVTYGTLNNSNTGGLVNVHPGPSRLSMDDSFYFEIPNGDYHGEPDWTAQGRAEFVLNIDEIPVNCREPDLVKDCAVTTEFKKRRPFSIRLFSTSGKKPDSSVLYPTPGDIFQTLTEIAANFPIKGYGGEGGVSLELDSWTIDQQYCNFDGMDALLRGLQAKRAADCATGTCEDFYIALLPESVVTGVCGANLATSGQAAINFGTPGMPGYPLRPPIGIKTDNSGNANAAVAGFWNSRTHELGHNFGFAHTCYTRGAAGGFTEGGCTEVRSGDGSVVLSDGTISLNKAEDDIDTYFGFDVYREKLTGVIGPSDCPPTASGCDNKYLNHGRIYGPNSPDMMSYGPAAWISAYSYKRLFDSLAPIAAREPEPLRVHADKIFQINGSVSGANSGELRSVYISELNGPVIVPPPTGDWTVSIRNAQNAEIAVYGLTLVSGSEPDGLATFSLVAPWSADARSISLMRNGQTVATRAASPAAPVVTLTAPNGGETLSGPTAAITWTASDADGGDLSFAIEHSSDGGTTWRTIALDLAGTSYSADLTRRAGTTQGLFRVTASDGFNSGSDESNSVFTIPPRAPLAAISAPVAGQVYVGDQLVTLRGTALDVESGVLPGSSLAWSSDLNGPLGTGEGVNIIAADLQEGTHTVTLTATDPAGQTAVSTSTIKIYRVRPNFPAAIDAGPALVSFSSNVGGPLTQPQNLVIRNAGDGTLAWTAETNQPWIVLASNSGTAPSNLEIRANPAGLPPGTYNGTVNLGAAGAANSPQSIAVTLVVLPPATITGRVVNPGLQAIRNAVVFLTDEAGVSRTATTSSFGVYSFTGVPNGGSYTLSVRSRRYRFSPRTIAVTADATLPDLVGLE